MATRAGSRGGAALRFEEMTRTERVMAAVRGEPVDRVPVCFWHHFQPDGSGRRLAEASLTFFDETFDLDILKIMPDKTTPNLLHINPGAAGRHGFHRIRTLVKFEIQEGKITKLQVVELGPRA